MRTLVGVSLCLIALSLPAAAAERRCGWLANPAPGDLLLTDRDGEWWITGGGGSDAKGIDRVPQFNDRQFVETNVPGSGHGYGCACMTVQTDAGTNRITRVFAADILPLERCRTNKSLPRPE